MSARSQLPGMRLFWWLRNRALRIGVITGVYLSFVFVAWLVVANRFPELQPFAGIRNIAAAVTVLLLMLIPVLRFRREPVRMFVAGLTRSWRAAWERFTSSCSAESLTASWRCSTGCFCFVRKRAINTSRKPRRQQLQRPGIQSTNPN